MKKEKNQVVIIDKRQLHRHRTLLHVFRGEEEENNKSPSIGDGVEITIDTDVVKRINENREKRDAPTSAS